MVFRQFIAMFKARTMEFVRDRGTFFWNLLFPVVLVLGLAFAFSGQGEAEFKIGVVGADDGTLPIMTLEQAQFIPYGDADAAAAMDKLRRHQLDLVVDFGTRRYAVNDQSANGSLLRRLLVAEQATKDSSPAVTSGTGPDKGSTPGPAPFSEMSVSGAPIRYADWLVPGIIGMNMMFSSLFGVGIVIVRYRKNGVLKRFKATPVHPLNFVVAQAASRLVIVLATSVVVYIATDLFLGFRMEGSYLNLFLVSALAILCMISIALALSSRMRSEELASGLLNLVTLPMMALSGVFFSLEGSPPILSKIAAFLPLTRFTEATRAIMLDGAGLGAVLPDLAYLAAMTVLFLVAAAAFFKWE